MIFSLAVSLIALIEPLKGQLYTGKKINTVQKPFQKGKECLKNVSERTQCLFIDNKSKRTLWLLGDSHAKSLDLAGEQVANSLDMNLKLFRAKVTPFPPVQKYRKSKKRIDLQRLDDFRFVEKELHRQIKVGDIIILSMRLPYHFGGTYYEYPSSDFSFIRKDGSFGSQDDSLDDWISSVINLANISQAQGGKIIIQTPTPEWEREKTKLCSNKNNQWFNILQNRNCQINSKFFIDKNQGLYKHLFEKLSRLSISHKNIFLFDTYKVVCPESMCSFTKKGIDIYRDDDHISNKWARDELAPAIFKFIKASLIP